MKILYIKLENFSSISTCMNTKSIEIDFTKCKNKIVLLEGENGTGKTSILSVLHPFATNGNLDVRSSITPIIQGENGYKEIHIQDGGNVYIIKHYYTASKESHTIKSYIMKNGVELNENGNVTSFKEVTLEELDIEPDLLKLIRIGNNVTNFIDMKTTERKTFMGKLLDEIDVFLQYFKKTTTDLREMKSIISHLTDKLKKLNINSIEELDEYIIKLIKRIDAINGELERAKADENIVDYKLNQMPSMAEIVSNLRELKSKKDKISKKLDTDINEITSDDILKLKESIIKMRSKLETCETNYALYMNDVDRLYTELHDSEIQLEKEDNNEYINSLKDIIHDLRNEVNIMEEAFKGFNPSYTAFDVEIVINSLYASQSILDATYEFGKGAVSKVAKGMKNNKNIPDFISDKLSKIENNRMQISANYLLNKLMKKMKIVYPACKDNAKCGVWQIWKEIVDMTQIKDSGEELHDEEFYNYMNMAYTNIKNAIKELNKSKEFFNKMPDEVKSMLEINLVYKRISNLEPIYDITLLYNTLSYVKEYELFRDKQKQLMEKEAELNVAEENSNKNKLINKITELNHSIEERENQLNDIKDTIGTLKSDIISSEESLIDMENLKELLDNAKSIEDNYNDYMNLYEECRSLSTKKQEVSSLVSAYELDINKMRKELSDIEFKKKEFKSLNKDLKKLNKKYDDQLYVRKSLSTKEGMPLYFIKIYLKKTASITNELLDIVYDGLLNIDDFDISETEFAIPYITKGKRLSDASFASQGERSFISLALSFALSFQSLSRYNVMLLDEVDSTLDTKNRMKFIAIVQKLMDMIDAEQIFIISHNNMFDMYPVDVVPTYDGAKNNKLANYIKIKKEIV